MLGELIISQSFQEKENPAVNKFNTVSVGA
jgi:hypothetical protein